jgi:phage baseplate assembly protein W
VSGGGGSSFGFGLATWLGGPAEQAGPQVSALGVDLYFGELGMSVSAIGDWAVVAGQLNFKLYTYRRLITNPGAIKARPNWGCGLGGALKKPFTNSLRAELKARITQQIPDDQRVRALREVDIVRDTVGGVVVFRVPIVIETIADVVTFEPLVSERNV